MPSKTCGISLSAPSLFLFQRLWLALGGLGVAELSLEARASEMGNDEASALILWVQQAE